MRDCQGDVKMYGSSRKIHDEYPWESDEKANSYKDRILTTRTEGKLGGRLQNPIPQKACPKRKELGEEKFSSFKAKINQNEYLTIKLNLFVIKYAVTWVTLTVNKIILSVAHRLYHNAVTVLRL